MSRPERPVAHTPREGSEEWHDLEEHLLQVAKAARTFAKPFGAGDIAYWIGLFHDLGKVSPQFQNYLTTGANKRDSVPHAIWGAALLYKMFKVQGRWQAALPILGHHAGLHDAGSAAQDLEKFCTDRSDAVETMKAFLTQVEREKVPFAFPDLSNTYFKELWLRILFSALVDADFLDTEKHFSPDKHETRNQWPNIAELQQRFAKKCKIYLSNVSKDKETSEEVARVRSEVYQACLDQAARDHPHNVFRLTVPTGGGKTLSGLAFALEHAQTQGLKRIIFAVPYTSITTQTAKVYREVLGANAVLEHHSAIQLPDDAKERQDQQSLRRQLASENWDASLIVTTTVQLFESLFARRTSKCRKLHNLAKSVIVLDEAQTLPPELLKPTLNVLRLLVEHFGISLVFCTATQPAFAESRYLEDFKDLKPIEIVSNFAEHFALLRRVTYERHQDKPSWAELAREIVELPEQQVLVILNSRKNALALLKEVQAKGEGKTDHVFHLSTLLCGAHRQKLLSDITQRLANNAPVLLVSTQVVEAGVDLDFQTVYRALGPLDRIVQAAGRCNREGKREARDSRLVIFEPAEGTNPSGPYKVGIEKAQLILHDGDLERLHHPDVYTDYFKRLFDDVNTDARGIQAMRADLSYEEVARHYRFIQPTVSVVVNYQDALENLRNYQSWPSRKTWQRLQPYLVSLMEHEKKRLGEWLEPVNESEDLFLWTGMYDAEHHRGIVEALYDPADLVFGGG